MPPGRKLQHDTKLAQAIKEDGRPAYQIALAAGLAQWQLGDYYSGRKIPGRTHLQRICAALGCDPEDILEDA